jgi:hypothetical protein
VPVHAPEWCVAFALPVASLTDSLMSSSYCTVHALRADEVAGALFSQVSARGDENTGLGKPATAKGGAANEGGRGTSSHGHMFHQPRKKVWTCGSQPRTRYGPFDPNNGRKLKCSSLGQAKAERMKLRAQEKTASKLASAQAAAREKRAQAEAKLNRRAARVDRADALRRTGHLPSSSSVFSLKLPLMCR